MPLSSLHYIFESRDQLVALAVHAIATDFGTDIDQESIDWTTVGSAVRTSIGQHLEQINRDPKRLTALFECLIYGVRTPELADLGRDRWAEDLLATRFYLELISQRLRVKYTIPEAALANMILMMTEGISLTWLRMRDNAIAWQGIDACVALVEHFSRPLEAGEEPSAELLSNATLLELVLSRAEHNHHGLGGWGEAAPDGDADGDGNAIGTTSDGAAAPSDA